jgi:hypothetical protein
MQYRDLNRMNDKGGEVGSVDGGLESSVKIEVDFRRNRSWSLLSRPYIFLQCWLLVSMQNTWNVNVLNNEKSSCRFPCAVVWQPFPPLTWFIPMIGHTGITDSHGVVHDFQGVLLYPHLSQTYTNIQLLFYFLCMCRVCE